MGRGAELKARALALLVVVAMMAVVNAKPDAAEVAEPPVPEAVTSSAWPEKMFQAKEARADDTIANVQEQQAAAWMTSSEKTLLQTNVVRADAVVAQDGTGQFTTIGAAIAAAPQQILGRHVIYVKSGLYDEILRVSKTTWNLTLIGDGMGATIITGNRSVVDHYPMAETATVGVDGPGFIAQDLTIRNTAGADKNQSVALRNRSDLSVVYRCSLEGYQDTLYAQGGNQFYGECNIFGTIDFIYGNAAAVFQRCLLMARVPRLGQENVLTAQGRDSADSKTGFVFQFCNISGDSLLRVKGVETFLGRPWKKFSRTVFMECSIDGVVNPLGYLPWDGSAGLDTLFYAEFKNSGLGSGTSGRVKWPGFHIIGATEAAAFTVANFIAGGTWLPRTEVEFTPGL